MNGQKQYARSSEIKPDGAILRIEQNLQSDLRLIDDAVAGMVAMVKGAGFIDDMDKVDLAIREAITNAMIHGNRCDQSKAVRICVTLHKRRGLLIVVKDAGRGFDPDRVPNPLVGQNRMANHGRGIFLMRKCMDDVQFGFDSGTAIYMRRFRVVKGTPSSRRHRADCSNIEVIEA